MSIKSVDMRKKLTKVLVYKDVEYPVGTIVTVSAVYGDNSCLSGRVATASLPNGVIAKFCASFIEPVKEE